MKNDKIFTISTCNIFIFETCESCMLNEALLVHKSVVSIHEQLLVSQQSSHGPINHHYMHRL